MANWWEQYPPRHSPRAVSQLLWPDTHREVWFSLGENHEKAYRFGQHPLRNCLGAQAFQAEERRDQGIDVFEAVVERQGRTHRGLDPEAA
jgi:hypothetical protein